MRIHTSTTGERRIVRSLAAITLALTVLGTSGCSMLTQFLPTSAPVRDAESGQITEQNKNADVFSIRVGDCLDTDDTETEEMYTVPVVPCNEPHSDEVYYAFNLDDGDYPGEDAIFDAVSERCLPEFDDFIGTVYEESTLDVWPMYPTAESWSSGDHEVLCIAYDPSGQVTGTLKGAAR